MKRNRRKRTLYLGPEEEDAVEAIRRAASLKTKASAIRFAVRATERRFREAPTLSEAAVLRLIEYATSLEMLPDRDASRLRILCADAKKSICGTPDVSR